LGRSGSGVKAASETTIQIEFIYQGISCRERIKLVPTAVNLKRAERHREAIVEGILNGTFDYSITFPKSKSLTKFTSLIDTDSMTVGAWLDQWQDNITDLVKSSTMDGYKKIIKRHKLHFGKIRLVDLGYNHIIEWCRSCTACNKTIANNLSVLNLALTEAKKVKLILANPLDDFTFERTEPPKKDLVDPFTQEEQEAIVATAPGHLGNYIKFAFWTGMRTSELCALRWSDINWDKSKIRVERAKTQYAKEDETTKTFAGTRQIKLLSPALDALLKQKELTFKNNRHINRHIFLNPFDELPWKGDDPIRKAWTIALKRAGVRYRNPYQTRHTYASLMLSAGELLPWISSQMGHSTTAQTTKAYARYIDDSQTDAGEKAVKMFTKNVD
jgi:integrase